MQPAAPAPPENIAEFDLEPGAHTLLVRAVDPSLNVDATPETLHAGRSSARRSRRSPSGPADGPADDRRRPRRSRSPPTRPASPTCARSTAPSSRRAPRRSPTPRRSCAAPSSTRAYGEHTFEVQATNRRTAARRGAAGEPHVDDRRPSTRARRRRSTPARPADDAEHDRDVHLLVERARRRPSSARSTASRSTGCGSPLRARRPRARRLHARGPRDRRGRQRRRDAGQPHAGRSRRRRRRTRRSAPNVVVDAHRPGARDGDLRRGHRRRLHLGDGARHRAGAAARATSTAGARLLRRQHHGRVLGAGDGLPAVRPGRVRRCRSRLLHHDGTEWVDVTLTADAVAGMVCGEVESLSPFAIAAGTALVVPETTIGSGPDAVDRRAGRDVRVLLERPDRGLRVRRSTTRRGARVGLLRRAVPDRGPAARPARAAGPRRERARHRRRDAGRPRVDGHPARHDDRRRPAGLDHGARSRTSRSPRTTRSRPSSARSTARRSAAARRRTELENLLAGPHELLVRARERRRHGRPDPGQLRLDDHADARHGDPRPAGRPDRQRHRDLHLHLQPPGRHVRVRAGRGGRQPALRAVHLAGHLHEPDLRRARLRRPRQGRRRQRRPDPAEWELGRRGPRRRRCSITSGPDVTTESRTATFDFAAEGRDLQYECALDGGAFSLCVSPKTYNGLPIGPHAFEVQVLVPDEAAEPEVTTCEWTVVENTRARDDDRLRPVRPELHVRPGDGRGHRDLRLREQRGAVTFECALDGAAVRRLPRSVALHRPDARPAHPPRPRGRPGPERRPTPASWTLDGRARHDAAGDDDQHRRASPAIEGVFVAIFTFTANEPVLDLRVPARRRAVRAVRVADGVQRPDAGRARVPRPRDRPGAERRAPAGDPHLRGRRGRDAARDDDPQRPAARSPTTTGRASSSRRASRSLYFECAIESSPTASRSEECFSPAQYVELEPGQHTFQVRAVDLSLNPDPTPATWTWTYEPATTAPETTIHTAPTNPSDDVNAVFPFSAIGAGRASSSARSTPSRSSRCESPFLHRGADARRAHVPGARDRHLRQRRAEPASYTWRCIAPPLEPTIESAPPEPSAGPQHTFTFSSTEPNATFECRITPNPFHEQPFEPCTSPHTYTEPAGRRVPVRGRAVNEFGIAGEIPAECDFEVAIPPDTTIVAGPSGPTAQHDRRLRLHLQRAGLDASSARSTASSFGECLSPAMFPDAEHRLPGDLARHAHLRGRRRSTSTATSTRRPPAAPGRSSRTRRPRRRSSTGRTARPPSTSATFAFSANEAGSTFECSLDGAAFAACASPPSSPAWRSATTSSGSRPPTRTATSTRRRRSTRGRSWRPTRRRRRRRSAHAPAARPRTPSASFTLLRRGRRDVRVLARRRRLRRLRLAVRLHRPRGRAAHLRGARDRRLRQHRRTRRRHTWTVDRAAPDTTITRPAGRPEQQRLRELRLRRHETRARASSAASTTARGSTAPPEGLRDLTDGPHTFSVRAVDAAGNVDPSPATYSLDGRPRCAGDDDRLRAGALDQHARARRSRSRRRPASTYECSLDGAAYAACTSPVDLHRPGRRRPHASRCARSTRPATSTRAPATHAWTVDLRARHDDRRPRPANPTASTTATFTSRRTSRASATSARSTAPAFSSCSSPAEYTDLAAGRRTSSASAPRTRRQRRRDAGHLHLDDHAGAGDDDRLVEPAIGRRLPDREHAA